MMFALNARLLVLRDEVAVGKAVRWFSILAVGKYMFPVLLHLCELATCSRRLEMAFLSSVNLLSLSLRALIVAK
jgi:hypothetical protein